MAIQAAEISAILRDQIRNFGREAEVAEVGRVLSVGDGIARIYGLDNIQAGEMVEFPGGIMGMALNLETDNVGCVIFGSDRDIKEGDVVKRTQSIVSVPAGDALLGRVVDALGNPIDGKGPIAATEMRVADVKAPGIIPRRSVHEPMATGLKAVDAMIPIGRGQRELLIGDRQTGKSAIILDTILNQKVYNEAAGRRRGQEALLRLRRHRAEALDRAPVRAPPRGDGRDGLLHRRGRDRLGPRADAVPGALLGDRHGGILPRQRPPRRDLLRRPVQAGRGLPPDVAPAAPSAGARGLSGRRVLPPLPPAGAVGEAQRRQRLGLAHRAPVVETQAGDISAYIPTNVISITDGQIFLESELFYQGVRPAVNTGLSGVPRGLLGADQGDEVGRGPGEAGARAVPRDGGLRAVRLGPRRLHAAAPQPGRAPDGADEAAAVLAAHQREIVAVIYAGTKGFLDKIPVAQVGAFEAGLLNHLRTRRRDVLDFITTQDPKIAGEAEQMLRGAIDEFARDFAA
jgi:F-type H+-transporting ATPase subunit alpha